MSATAKRPRIKRRVEIAPGVTYREWVNARRRFACICKADCVAADLKTADGLLSFRFGLNFTRDQLLNLGPKKAAMMFALVASLHNMLREIAGQTTENPAISAEGLAVQVLADPGVLQ